jgi:hypothetical protein
VRGLVYGDGANMMRLQAVCARANRIDLAFNLHKTFATPGGRPARALSRLARYCRLSAGTVVDAAPGGKKE